MILLFMPGQPRALGYSTKTLCRSGLIWKTKQALASVTVSSTSMKIMPNLALGIQPRVITDSKER
jgi:hypothetical protein